MSSSVLSSAPKSFELDSLSLWPHIPGYVGGSVLASISTAHLVQNSVLGVAVVEHPPTCMSFTTLHLLVQTVVLFGPLSALT